MIIKKTFKDLKKYFEYILFAARSDLRNEVAGSYLSWFWWILDPIFFMLVYTFVVKGIFNSPKENFPVFVFIGITTWQFFNGTMMKSVNIIRSYRGIISKVYVPKYIFILVNMARSLVKMGISFSLVFILMLFYRIPYSLHMLYIFPIIMMFFIVTFSFSVIVAHIGVFVTDFSNILGVILRFMFYLSGVLYSVTDRLPESLQNIMFFLNPVSVMIHQFRNVIMYQTHPNPIHLFYWTIVCSILALIGLKLMYRFENTYVKVV